jgi:hypothetical protein
MLLTLLVWSIAGCGSDDAPDVVQGVIVKGQIISEEHPLTMENAPPGTGAGQVSLVPVEEHSADGQDPVYPTTMVDDQGNFEFRGDGQGVPAGKYRLAVVPAEMPGAPTESIDTNHSNPIARKFSVKKSPIEVTVPADKVGEQHDLGIIDLGNYLKK